jgi:sugar phosphate isomerase/epimerase
MKMQLGLSSYSYTWAVGVPGSMPESPMSVRLLVDKASDLQVDLLQVADNMPLEVFSGLQLEDIFKYASDKGIAIEMGGRGLTPEHTLQCLKAAEKLKSPILRMVVDQKDFEPDIKSIITIIKGLIPEFKSRNIRLAIENHDRLKAQEFKQIIEETDTEWVGICLDSVNSMGAGEGFETVSEILLPYTINLHLKDFSIRRVSHKMGFVIEGTPAGMGMLNIKQLVNDLESMKRCGSAILELWTPYQSDVEETIKLEESWAKQSIDFLKPIFNKI